MVDFFASYPSAPNKTYDPDSIEKFAHACLAADESAFRTLYYDCAIYSGTIKPSVPVSDAGCERNNWSHYE